MKLVVRLSKIFSKKLRHTVLLAQKSQKFHQSHIIKTSPMHIRCVCLTLRWASVGSMVLFPIMEAKIIRPV